MGTIWDSPYLGEVCRTPSADLGKSRQGFAIKHSSNMGVKGHLPHSGDVCWAPPADLGKFRWVWQSCILINFRYNGEQ